MAMRGIKVKYTGKDVELDIFMAICPSQWNTQRGRLEEDVFFVDKESLYDYKPLLHDTFVQHGHIEPVYQVTNVEVFSHVESGYMLTVMVKKQK